MDDNSRQRLIRAAQDDPEGTWIAYQRVAALSNYENAILLGLSSAERLQAFQRSEEDGSSMEVALTEVARHA